MQESFNQATQDFTPAAMERAKNIRINITPLKGNPKFGNPLIAVNENSAPTGFGPMATLGIMPVGAAGQYNGGSERGEISVDPQYMDQMPRILRHELIHSMDTGVNFGRPTSLPENPSGPDGEPSQQEFEQAIARDNELTKKISILQKYLTGMGIVDSNNFYPSMNPSVQEDIRRAVSGPLYTRGGKVDPRTLNSEGLAYMGEAGPLSYQLPQYRPIINQANGFSVPGTVVPNSGGQRLQLKKFKGVLENK